MPYFKIIFENKKILNVNGAFICNLTLFNRCVSNRFYNNQLGIIFWYHLLLFHCFSVSTAIYKLQMRVVFPHLWPNTKYMYIIPGNSVCFRSFHIYIMKKFCWPILWILYSVSLSSGSDVSTQLLSTWTHSLFLRARVPGVRRFLWRAEFNTAFGK